MLANQNIPELVRQIRESKWHYAYDKYKDISKDNECVLVDWRLTKFDDGTYIYFVYWFEVINGNFYRNEKAFRNVKPESWWQHIACDKDLN